VSWEISFSTLHFCLFPLSHLPSNVALHLLIRTIRAFGKINIIVNNAGFTFDAMLHKTTDKQYQLMLEVHNAAPFRIIRAAAKYMRVNDGEPRSIVNVCPSAHLLLSPLCLFVPDMQDGAFMI